MCQEYYIDLFLNGVEKQHSGSNKYSDNCEVCPGQPASVLIQQRLRGIDNDRMAMPRIHS